MQDLPTQKHDTFADYLDLPDDGNRYEIIHGVLHVTPAPTVSHQKVSARLHLLLAEWVRSRVGGELLYAPVDVHLTDDTNVQPDLLWIAPERVSRLIGDRVRGAPDLVIEILSPGTARRDRTIKRDLYAEHGVREYWLVDISQARVTMLRLEGLGFVEQASGSGEAILESSLEGCLSLTPARLFES